MTEVTPSNALLSDVHRHKYLAEHLANLHRQYETAVALKLNSASCQKISAEIEATERAIAAIDKP